MQSIKQMGILYGKLGLSTDADLIARRAIGVEAAANALQSEDIPEILRCIFGLERQNSELVFLNHFSEKDPTFGVQSSDQEAALLASSIVAYEMEDDTELSGLLALYLVTASLGGIRPPILDNKLLGLADQTLVTAQSKATQIPSDRRHTQRPESLSSFEEVGDYAEKISSKAAQNDNVILKYIRQLEEELRIQWWVSGDWCTDASKAFSKFKPIEAALRAGKELADKSSIELGLFAAPALLNTVIKTGRKTSSKDATLAEAATSPDHSWRSETFRSTAEESLADLLPLTTAQGLAALSKDANDWQPRFERLSGIDPLRKLKPHDLALQLYRERLMLRSLEG